jgi:hypothetical protein
MKVLKILGIVFGILLLLTGGGLLAGSALAGKGQSAFDSELAKQGFAGPVDGTVKSVDSTQPVLLTVTFTDKEGHSQTGQGASSNTAVPKVGAIVPVYYQTSDPTQIVVVDVPGAGSLSKVGSALQTGGIVCLVIGAVLLLAGIVGLVMGKKTVPVAAGQPAAPLAQAAGPYPSGPPPNPQNPGYPQQGPPPGYPPQGPPPGYPPQGPPPGYPQQGPPPGYPPQQYPPAPNPPQQNAPQGYPPQGPPPGYPQQGPPPGYPQQNPPQGYPPQGQPPQHPPSAR